MLRELAVQNLAVIEDVRVEFRPGFNALTGETGAGKSLLLGAVGLLLGERGSADLIRAGKEELRVTGVFDLTRKEQRAVAEEVLQTTLEEPELVITRKLSRSGRSSALANEQPVAVATLRRLGDVLVDVHGQRESYSLLKPAYQLDLLDAFGKLSGPRNKYTDAAGRVRELRTRHKALLDAGEMRRRDLSLVRFERDDLDAAALKSNERADLERERDRLSHARGLAEFASNAASRLYDDEGSIVEGLGKLNKDAHHWARFDPGIADVARRLDILRPEVQDLAEVCRDLSERFEADPERLEEVERRLVFLTKLEAKYGKSAEELVDYRKSLDARETALQQQESNLSAVETELRDAFKDLKSSAAELSKLRQKTIKKLVNDVERELRDLQMPSAKFDTLLDPVSLGNDPFSGEVPAAGAETLEFLLAANPGEPARPLRKVASGGELSRTMLALKTVLAAHDPVRTLVVFDEIDANVGGRLGDVLGKKLATLGRSHQVLCVTHLPQVAGFAAHQWTIRKQLVGKRTTTTILPLTTDADRIEELALMLRGEARSATTRAEAAAMLKAAKKVG